MEIDIKKEVTGSHQETYLGEFTIKTRAVVNFEPKDAFGRDLRDTNPKQARRMVNDTKRRMTELIVGEMTKIIIGELEKVAKTQKGLQYVDTPLVRQRLLLINPKEIPKWLKEEVKPSGVSLRKPEERTCQRRGKVEK